MKWNWGTGIALSFTVFCGLMIYMVVQSFQTDFFLVSNQYYVDELKYQERIDELERTKNTEILISQVVAESALRFTIDTDKRISGQIHFYRPDNALLDHIVKFNDNNIAVEKSELTPGRYIAKISWLDHDKSYYQEKELIIR